MLTRAAFCRRIVYSYLVNKRGIHQDVFEIRTDPRVVFMAGSVIDKDFNSVSRVDLLNYFLPFLRTHSFLGIELSCLIFKIGRSMATELTKLCG